MKIPEVESNYKRCPAGIMAGICQSVIDLGTHEDKFGVKRQLRIEWQVPCELDDDGDPFVVGADYTFSSHKKANLRKMLESWRGAPFTESQLREFELESLLGKPCALIVSHNDAGYPVVQTVTRQPVDMLTRPMVGTTLLFSLDPGACDLSLLKHMPTWIANKIRSSEEYQAISTGESEHGSLPADIHDEDIPF